MSALIAERNTLRLDGSGAALPDYLRYGLAASAKLWQGGMVAVNAAGNVQPPQTAGSVACVGRAENDVDNSSGSAGALTAQIGVGAFKWAQGSGADAITTANRFQKCYAIDDQTVGLTNGYTLGAVRPLAGIILDVDADNGVWVLMGPELMIDLAQMSMPAMVHTARCVCNQALGAYTASAGVITANANGAIGSKFDGITVAVGDVILLPAGIAASAADEGLWVVTALGSAGAKFTLQRPLDWQTGSAIQNGSIVEVREGTLFANSTWKSTATGANVVDTNAPLFYPREVTQQVTLVAGTATINNVPILSASKSSVAFTRVTAGGTASTIMYAPIGGLTAGALGTATFNAQAAVAAGTINASDTSTLNVTVINW